MPPWSARSIVMRTSIRRRSTAAARSGRNGTRRMQMAEPARQLDVIDARPAFTQADADALNARFEGVDTLSMLKTVFAEGLAGNVAVVSSFGTESAVLLDLVAKADKNVPVIFVDTLKMFRETLDYRETLIRTLGFTDSRAVAPHAEVLAAKDETGLRWSYDPDERKSVV